MLPEAALFVMAEDMLVEVLGRIRPQDEGVVLPPLHVRAGRSRTLAVAVAQHLQDEADVRAALTRDAQRGAAQPGDAQPGAAQPADRDVAAAARLTCDVVARQEDGQRVVRSDGVPVRVRTLLIRATLERALLAHYVAAHLGSTACPLPEELARPLWELTSPDADAWRRAGWFRAPLPLPPHVSWRDRFLLTAGHPPHPLGH